MAKKYIDVEAAFKVMRDISNHYHETYVSNARVETAEWCLKKLKELPAADVAEVQHAHWEIKYKWEPLAWDTGPLDWDRYDEKTHSEEVDYYACSKCGYDGGSWKPSWKYCPDCGAKMDAKMKRSKKDDV